MTVLNATCRVALVSMVAAEAGAWVLRRRNHCKQLDLALKRAFALQRPLVVFGDRSSCARGRRSLGYGFAVLIPDPNFGTICEEAAPRDLAEAPDDSCVVLIAGVLEYATDPDAILALLRRVAGDHLYFSARVQPWTLTAAALARRTGPDSRPVTSLRRVGAAGLVATVLLGALWPTDEGKGGT